MWSSILMLVIAFFILLLAIAMKVLAKTSDSRMVFQLSVMGFLLLYIFAAIAISWLHPRLPGANIASFSELVKPPTPTEDTPSPPQDTIIRQ